MRGNYVRAYTYKTYNGTALICYKEMLTTSAFFLLKPQ